MNRKKDHEGRDLYGDFSNAETMHNFFIPEEFSDGPYGSPVNHELGKSNWEEGQRPYSAFNYEFKSFHEDIPRQFPGAHQPHDDPDADRVPPYQRP
ncbi:cytosolic protein [Anaerobacillus sp. MEB173]|uniref:cytosolic protein n=1 Tax=Anaerobacillus sp. MEB173 TaxID=3383345 RepID=UPI003F938914